MGRLSLSRSRPGPSRDRHTTMSTVDSTPDPDGWNRFVAGRATCSVDDQVGAAT